MIGSFTPGVIRTVQKFISQDDLLVSFDRPIELVAGIKGKVLQALSCTVQIDPDSPTKYDNTLYVFTQTPSTPQLIWLGFETTGFSILSQSITGDIGNACVEGQPLYIGFPLQNPTQGEGGAWVSLMYTIWPDKSEDF